MVGRRRARWRRGFFLCRDSAYTLSARTSRWPSAKSAVSPGRVGMGGWGALSLVCSGPFCVSVCRPGCWPCWGSRAPMGPQAPGGCSPSRLCSAQRPPSAPQRFLRGRLKAFLPILSPSSRIYHLQPVLNPTPVLDQECGQGACLSPGAQTPPGAGDAGLLGEFYGGQDTPQGSPHPMSRPDLSTVPGPPSCPALLPRCPGCCRPWAACGACGSAPQSCRCWSCWSCCWTPQPSPCS